MKMKVIDIKDLHGTEREIHCPKGGFVSRRILIKSDNMGYTMTETTVPVGEKQRWHYKNHLESCYCVKGEGVLENITTGETFDIYPGVTYVLDKNDPHYFTAKKEVVLVCVFNPPLNGKEVHKEDGSY